MPLWDVNHHNMYIMNRHYKVEPRLLKKATDLYILTQEKNIYLTTYTVLGFSFPLQFQNTKNANSISLEDLSQTWKSTKETLWLSTVSTVRVAELQGTCLCAGGFILAKGAGSIGGMKGRIPLFFWTCSYTLTADRTIDSMCFSGKWVLTLTIYIYLEEMHNWCLLIQTHTSPQVSWMLRDNLFISVEVRRQCSLGGRWISKVREQQRVFSALLCFKTG